MMVLMSGIELDDDWEEAEAIPVGPNHLFEDQRITVHWLPLVPSSTTHPFWLGPTSDGDWVQSAPLRYERPQRKPLLFADRYDPGFYYAMPLLDYSPSHVKSQAIFGAERHGLDGPATWLRLPWRGIVRSGLRSLRLQWVSPAMDWVAALELADDFSDELGNIGRDSNLPNEVCERAVRLVRPASV